MNKIMCFGLMLMMSTAVFAFGGGGSSNRVNKAIKGGVNALGIHYGGTEAPDIEFRECDEQTETLVDRACCPNVRVAINGGSQTCCKEGFVSKGPENAQICCRQDEVEKNGECVDEDTYQCLSTCEAPNACLPNGEE